MPLYDIEVQAVFGVKTRINAETKEQAVRIAYRAVNPRIDDNAVDITDTRVVDYAYDLTPTYTQVNPEIKETLL